MKNFRQILQDKTIWPLSASPQMSQHIEKEVTDAVIELLKQYKEYLPDRDVTEHAKGAHDAIDDLYTWVVPRQMEVKP